MKELHMDRPYVYFCAVMVLYIKMKKIDPYAGNTTQFHRFDDNDSLELFTKTLLDRLNTEYLDDDYDIQDVTISRKLFTLTIETIDGINEYSIPIDAYPFLRNLRVFDEVTIKKDTRTEELFVSWPWAGYEIPLSEFKINM